ncbi:FG-GAP repeat protein [Microbispora sp. NPDC049125]|uniref:FG-GAP repeat protein n=1 Tax=Microbispora sp. NPDC049125 TaxID=3154929 RepID=UPI0034669272
MRLTRSLVALLLPAAVLLPATVWPSGTAAARAGCATASAADTDGDGTDDVIAADPFAEVDGKEGAGAVHVLLGGGRGGTLVLHAPEPAAGDGFGWSVRTAHVDGDRCLDVIVGAPYADGEGGPDSGAVYVFHGRPGAPPLVSALRPAKGQRDGHFGWSLAAAEQTGGALVAVGEPHADSDGEKDSGAIHLFEASGDVAGAASTGTVTGVVRPLAVITQDSAGIIGNSEVGDMYGWALALGDLGGKPDVLDLAVGVPYENDDGTGRQVASGKIDAGMVGVVFDVATAKGSYTSAKWDLRQATTTVREASGDRFGYTLDYAEWKGNGYLAAGAPLADADARDDGVVQIFAREGAGEVRPLRALKGVPAWSLTWWDARGVLSLAAGCPYAGSGGREAGTVRSIALDGDEGDPLLSGAAGGEHLGTSVSDSGGGNAVTPGTSLVVGAPDRDATGRVAVLGDGPPAFHGPGEVEGGGSADFGASVAG